MRAFSEESAYISVLILLVVVLILVLSRHISIEMRSRFSRLDLKLDLLLKRAGVEHDPYKDLPAEVRDALQRGQKIQAIYHYRKATGVGLKEAKGLIEDAQRRAGDAS